MSSEIYYLYEENAPPALYTGRKPSLANITLGENCLPHQNIFGILQIKQINNIMELRYDEAKLLNAEKIFNPCL